MLPIVGSIVVIASVLGGFVLSHGQVMALWQPYELLVIGGAAMGGFLIANPMRVVKSVFSAIIGVLKGPHYGKKHYLDILALLFELLSTARKSGMMSLESHIEDPKASAIFSKYPLIQKDHHLIEFITDCLRMIVSGNMGPNELEPLLDLELETHHHEAEAASHALTRVSDSLPGFGIVAAVLGIVITMGSIGGDIAAVGAHVAAALVGTFLGILLAYGFVGPLAVAMEGAAKADAKAFEAVKMGLVASLHGYNPNIAVEFARKTLNSDMRPTFAQLETHLKGQK